MIYSGTGHRPNKLGGYSPDNDVRLYEFALKYIPSNAKKIISGMALGWDTALAKAAIAKQLPFIAAIPFYGFHTKWPEASQQTFLSLLQKASDILYICDVGYAPWKMQMRNEYMVDHSDTVLALWNGDTSGGTYNCIQYAMKKHKPILNLWNNYIENPTH